MTDRELNEAICRDFFKMEISSMATTAEGKTMWCKSRCHFPTPDYSTNIQYAMEIVEELRNSHKWCCVNIHSDYNYRWDVSLTPASNNEGLRPDGHKATVYVSTDDLPRAICLAALESLKH